MYETVYICISVYIHADLARGYLSHVITPMMLYSVLCWIINLFQIVCFKLKLKLLDISATLDASDMMHDMSHSPLKLFLIHYDMIV